MPARPSNMTLFPLDDDGQPAPAQRRKAKTKAPPKKAKAAAKPSPAHLEVEQRLRRALGTKAVLVDKGGKGTITVAWHGYDHLESLLAKLGA